VKARFQLEGAVHAVSPVRRPGGVDVVVDGRRHAVEARDLGAHERLLMIDGQPWRVFVARRGDVVHVHAGGRSFAVRHVAETDVRGAGGAAADTVLAPMPGVVVAVKAAPGDAVARGDVLLVIESMKLETALKAPRDGVVARLPVDAGGSFDKGALLAALEPLPDPLAE
jgi:acetyl/propionyl-CoA carboxylase alpha subunit